MRAHVVGHVASWLDCYRFRSTLAADAGCSVRTVQRALNDARALGLIGVARAKKGEVPPGAKGPLKCGWSHRWVTARDKVGAALKAAIAQARLGYLTRQAARAQSQKRQWPAERARTAAAELEQRRQQAQRDLADWEREIRAMADAAARAGPGRHN